MLHLVQFDRFYCPETISVMTAAFSTAALGDRYSARRERLGRLDISSTLKYVPAQHLHDALLARFVSSALIQR